MIHRPDRAATSNLCIGSGSVLNPAHWWTTSHPVPRSQSLNGDIAGVLDGVIIYDLQSTLTVEIRERHGSTHSEPEEGADVGRKESPRVRRYGSTTREQQVGPHADDSSWILRDVGRQKTMAAVTVPIVEQQTSEEEPTATAPQTLASCGSGVTD